MENKSSVVFSGIAPHPPIMVPEVGGDAIEKVRGSIEAMAEFSRRIIQNGTETVVLISPHAPLQPHSFVTYQSPLLAGSFANFRAPQTTVEFQLDSDLLEVLIETSAAGGFEIAGLTNHDLDHGSAVPLYFLGRNGWHGRVIALGYSFLSNEDHIKFGACIKTAVDATERAVAIVASGDLSHRLKPDAPAGYYPQAYRFDEEIVQAIETNSFELITKVDQDLRRLAGECGYRSMLVGLGAIQQLPSQCEVLHYEAPFGVGYLVAQLTNELATGKSV